MIDVEYEEKQDRNRQLRNLRGMPSPKFQEVPTSFIVKLLGIKQSLYKVKWEETDPLKWSELKLENKLIQKERVFSAESLTEAQDIANHSFHLCQFNLYRYDEELHDFDYEKDLQFAIEEK